MLSLPPPRAPPPPLACAEPVPQLLDALEGFAFATATTSTHHSLLLTGSRHSRHTATLHTHPGDSFAALAGSVCGPLSADAHLACDDGLVTGRCSATFALKAVRLEAEHSWPGSETALLCGTPDHSLALRLPASAPTLELQLARRQLTATVARDGPAELRLRAQSRLDSQLLERSLSLRRSPDGPELRAAAACVAGPATLRSALLACPCGVRESSLAVSLPCGAAVLNGKAARTSAGGLRCALSGRFRRMLDVTLSWDDEGPRAELAHEGAACFAAAVTADGVAAALHWGLLRRS